MNNIGKCALFSLIVLCCIILYTPRAQSQTVYNYHLQEEIHPEAYKNVYFPSHGHSFIIRRYSERYNHFNWSELLFDKDTAVGAQVTQRTDMVYGDMLFSPNGKWYAFYSRDAYFNGKKRSWVTTVGKFIYDWNFPEASQLLHFPEKHFPIAITDDGWLITAKPKFKSTFAIQLTGLKKVNTFTGEEKAITSEGWWPDATPNFTARLTPDYSRLVIAWSYETYVFDLQTGKKQVLPIKDARTNSQYTFIGNKHLIINQKNYPDTTYKASLYDLSTGELLYEQAVTQHNPLQLFKDTVYYFDDKENLLLEGYVNDKKELVISNTYIVPNETFDIPKKNVFYKILDDDKMVAIPMKERKSYESENFSNPSLLLIDIKTGNVLRNYMQAFYSPSKNSVVYNSNNSSWVAGKADASCSEEVKKLSFKPGSTIEPVNTFNLMNDDIVYAFIRDYDCNLDKYIINYVTKAGRYSNRKLSTYELPEASYKISNHKMVHCSECNGFGSIRSSSVVGAGEKKVEYLGLNTFKVWNSSGKIVTDDFQCTKCKGKGYLLQ